MMSYKTAQEIRDFIVSCKASTEIYLQALDSPKNMSNCKTCNGFGFMFINMSTGFLYAPKEGYINPPSKHEGKQLCPHCDPKSLNLYKNQPCITFMDEENIETITVSSEVVKIIKAAVMALDPNDIEKLKNILTIEQK